MDSSFIQTFLESSPVTAVALAMLILFSKNMAAERKASKETIELFTSTINNHLGEVTKGLTELVSVIQHLSGNLKP